MDKSNARWFSFFFLATIALLIATLIYKDEAEKGERRLQATFLAVQQLDAALDREECSSEGKERLQRKIDNVHSAIDGD